MQGQKTAKGSKNCIENKSHYHHEYNDKNHFKNCAVTPGVPVFWGCGYRPLIMNTKNYPKNNGGRSRKAAAAPDHPRAPLVVREHARGVSGNPGFSRKDPGDLGCLVLILTRVCTDFPHYLN
jgi:hypothetical protein